MCAQPTQPERGKVTNDKSPEALIALARRHVERKQLLGWDEGEALLAAGDRLAEALSRCTGTSRTVGSGTVLVRFPEDAWDVLRAFALASWVGTEETTEPLTTREDIERDTWTPEKQREIAKRVGTEETT